ncbi:hypothetical protein [Paeniglutamicibacter kerguelensis]|uniref:DUF4064 domain-containing protein n=1 Tax=Paeniglutamicibacter kerguelensis TaxID=254788 RepID=A0ABS4XFJ8_9MICC|nr:hypothetical protein [Paeniglutamicibacter kerguelensis]MBP2387101.1 hypothetical protein [Paeniglutamicibacter kerguelensis]
MSTPENEPENPQTPPANPTPPQYGQVAPQGQNPPVPPPYGQAPQPGAPQQNPYGQNPNPYGQNPYGQNPNPYGQPPQAPTPYGQQPYGTGFPVPPQGNFPAPQMPTERPKELDIAFWVIIAAGVLSVLGAVIGFDANLIRQQLATVPELDQQLQATGMSIDAFLSFLHTMIIVFSVISLAIYVLLAFMIRKGSNVARIFATVFAALSVFGLLGGTLLSILSILAGVVGVVFAWLRPASAYIAARRAARAAGYR